MTDNAGFHKPWNVPGFNNLECSISLEQVLNQRDTMYSWSCGWHSKTRPKSFWDVSIGTTCNSWEPIPNTLKITCYDSSTFVTCSYNPPRNYMVSSLMNETEPSRHRMCCLCIYYVSLYVKNSKYIIAKTLILTCNLCCVCLHVWLLLDSMYLSHIYWVNGGFFSIRNWLFLKKICYRSRGVLNIELERTILLPISKEYLELGSLTIVSQFLECSPSNWHDTGNWDCSISKYAHFCNCMCYCM